MTAIVIIIPVYNEVALRLGADAALREQYQRECDALDQTAREPPPRTRPIALPSRMTGGGS